MVGCSLHSAAVLLIGTGCWWCASRIAAAPIHIIWSSLPLPLQLPLSRFHSSQQQSSVRVEILLV